MVDGDSVGLPRGPGVVLQRVREFRVWCCLVDLFVEAKVFYLPLLSGAKLRFKNFGHNTKTTSTYVNLHEKSIPGGLRA